MTRPNATRDARPEPAVLGAVVLGGAAGSLLRYAVSNGVHPSADGFPWGTLIINLSGSFLLGALLVAVTEVWRPHHLLRPLLGTGLLGGYTTFSTFALEVRGASGAVAASYLIASVAGGVFVAWCGMAAVRRLEPRLRIAPEHGSADSVDPDLP